MFISLYVVYGGGGRVFLSVCVCVCVCVGGGGGCSPPPPPHAIWKIPSHQILPLRQIFTDIPPDLGHCELISKNNFDGSAPMLNHTLLHQSYSSHEIRIF